MARVGRKLFWWVFIPLALVALLVFSLPYILQNIDYKGLLVWQLETKLHRKVELGTASVEIFPHVRIALEGITVREPGSTTVFLTADRLFVDLRVFPLLAQKVLVKRILFEHPRVIITRGKDGRLNITDLFTSAQDGGVTVPMLGEESAITEGEIVFNDAYQTDTVRSITVSQLNTKFKAGLREVTIKFSAAIPYEKKAGTVSISAKLPLQGKQNGGLAERGEGRLEARGVNLAQLSPFLQGRGLVGGMHGLADLSANFEYRSGKDEDSLTLKDLRLNAAGTAVSGSAVIKGVLTKPAGFIASLTTSQFQIESLISGLSDDMLRDRSLEFLKKAEVRGPIRLISVRINGNPEREQPVTVQGEVEVLGVHALIGTRRIPISDVRGVLRVDADHVSIERLTGKYGEAEVTAGRGEITHLMDTPQLYLAAKGKVSAQELAAIIARFAPREVLPEGVKGLRDLKGEGEATVLLSGPLAEMEDLHVEWDVDAHGLGFGDPRLPLPVTGVSGKVRSIPHGIVFEHVSGIAGNTNVALDGEIRYPPHEKTAYDLKIAGRGELADLWKMIIVEAPENLTMNGPTEFKLNLSGDAERLTTTGSLDLTLAAITNQSGWGKAEGVPGTAEFSLAVKPGHRVKVERFAFDVPPFHLAARGHVLLGNPRRFVLSVHIPPVALRALPKGMAGSTVTAKSGTMQADLALDGAMDNVKLTNIRGRVLIKNAGFTMERLEHPVDDLHLDILFQDNRIEIDRASVKVEDSQINAKATIRGWRGIPIIEVTLDSPGMDLELLIPKGERSPVRTALETLTKETKLSGTVSIQDSTYKGIAFEDIQAKLQGGDSKLIVDSVDARLPTGTVRGQLTLSLVPERPLGLESSLEIEKVPVEPFIKAFGIKDSPVTGLLSLKGYGRGISGTYNGLDGDINLVIDSGHFQRLSAAGKVFGLLNLPSLLAGKVDFSNRGMPFDCLSAHLMLKNGHAQVDRYVVDSPIIKMTAAGEYDLPSNSANMVMAVSPLGSYSDLIEKLPVFGKLFIGDRQELVTAFYEVKGPLEDPRVRLLPIKSVASGMGTVAEMALDIMKNVFLLPKELLAPSKKAASPCATF